MIQTVQMLVIFGLMVVLIMDDIIEIVRSEVARQLANIVVRAPVTDIDHDTQRIKTKVGGGESGWIEFSGSTSNWSPPKIGASVISLNPCGDPDQGVIINGGYSDDNPPPSTAPDSFVEKRGSSTFTVADGKITLETDVATITANTIILDGKVLLGGALAARPVEFSPKVFVV